MSTLEVDEEDIQKHGFNHLYVMCDNISQQASRDANITTKTELRYQVHDKTLVITADATEGCGGHVWVSGVLLAQALQSTHYFGDGYWRGKRVVELGAGTGIAGLAACVLGSDVTITDLPQLLPIMQHNIDVNFSGSDSVHAEALPWGSPTSYTTPFDVVLAADVLYLESTFPLLLYTLLELCPVGGNTVCYMGYQRRWRQDWRFFKSVLPRYFDVILLNDAYIPQVQGDNDQVAHAGKRQSHVYMMKRKK